MSLLRVVCTWFDVRWIDPSLSYLQKLFSRHFKSIFDFSRLIWSRKVRQRLTKTQKFRESQLALKNKILPFARCLRLSFTATFCNSMIWCALDSPGPGKPFKYLERYHITSRKILEPPEVKKCAQNWKNWEISRVSIDSQKTRFSRHFWAHFWLQVALTFFSIGDMVTSKVFKRSSWTRVV